MALNLNVTELRSFSPQGPAKTSDKLTSDDARKLLVDIRSQLVGKNGTIQSGYLRIHNNKQVDGETQDVLTTQGRFSGTKADKTAATGFVSQLVKKAYGETLTKEQKTHLWKNLEAYITTSGTRFGTQSFVKLINALELRAGEAASGNVKRNARLATTGLGEVAQPAPPPLPPGVSFQKSLPAAECGSPAAAQFGELKGYLKLGTEDFFQHLFKPLKPDSAAQISETGVVNATKPTYVLGDADGSVCRTALASMNCGMMKLDSEGLKTLAEVMDAEAAATKSPDGLRAFQQNREISGKIADLVNQATFSEGQSKFVSIGDILHDRFSNNKEAMATLIERLHEKGAVFITGNHDVYDEVNLSGNLLDTEFEYLEKTFGFNKAQVDAMPESELLPLVEEMEEDFARFKEQNGFYGARQLTKEASDALNSKCFVNAYFDKANAVLYTHNGVVLAPNSVSGPGFEGFETYSTGLGEITPDKAGAEALAEKMNKTTYNRDVGNFTDFRPQDNQMQTEQLGSIATWEGRPVRFVHGHDASHGVTGNVINVNARAEGGVSPILMVIE